MTHDECEAMCEELIQDPESSIFDFFFFICRILFRVIIVIDDPRCLVSMWSAWSSCLNATCHRPGTQIRARMYADKRAAMVARCSERLKQQKQCTLDCNNNNLKNDENKQMTTG